MPIADYLVGSLDDKGYLSMLGRGSRLRPGGLRGSRQAACWRSLQSQEPIGIGARNLHECLLIQLAYLDVLGIKQPYAREIIETYLVELGEHKFGKIAHELKISPESGLGRLGVRQGEAQPASCRTASRPPTPGTAIPGRCTSCRTSSSPRARATSRSRWSSRGGSCCGSTRCTPASPASCRRAGRSPLRRSATFSSTSAGPSCSSPTSTSAARRSTTSRPAWWGSSATSWRRACATCGR